MGLTYTFMKELIKWIKRNISVSIVALCVSIISDYRKINYITLTALLMPLFSIIISIVLSTYYYNNSDGIDIFMTVQIFTSLFGGMYLLGNIKY